jgi:catechol 2,3-dioxygenase-like lactoylglutathione lyase family enzyme
MCHHPNQSGPDAVELSAGLRGGSQASGPGTGVDGLGTGACGDITRGRRRLLLGLLCGLTALKPAFAAIKPPTEEAEPLMGIDHIPLVVNDVDAAADSYRRLGFAIKPGRFHPDGIRNQHIKFPDGAGIELITAPAATDDLTTHYRQLLAQGEGPAHVSFHSTSLVALGNALKRRQIGYSLNGGLLVPNDPALQSFFLFEGSNRSSTDRPEYFAHTNTARATIGVWLAGGDQSGMIAFFESLGAPVRQQRVWVPDPLTTTVAQVANGQVIFLPPNRQLISGRPIMGIVFQTESFDAAQRALVAAGISNPPQVSTADYRSLFVGPRYTHGTWIEFRSRQ